jgi:hypothetical protein
VLVKRNQTRFPQDFMLQLSLREDKNLRSQLRPQDSATVGVDTCPTRSRNMEQLWQRPYAARGMRSEMSVFVVRAFVRLREMLATNGKVAAKLADLEHRLKGHNAYGSTVALFHVLCASR